MDDHQKLEVFEAGRLYTAEEAAERLKLSPSAVLQRARKGALACVKYGQERRQRVAVRFLGRDLNEWLGEMYRGVGSGGDAGRCVGADQRDRMRDFLGWRERRQQSGDR